MSEFNIEKANFDEQKDKLRKFADQPATSTKLNYVDEKGGVHDFLKDGFFGLKNRSVTGQEMNELVRNLQRCFIEINKREGKVIKEFGQVYETFEALDKEYIQGIIVAVKSAEKASNEAKNAQNDVSATIEALQKTVQKLKEFKDNIKLHEHLKDIDDMWINLEYLKTSINNLFSEQNQKYVKLQQKIDDFGNMSDAVGKATDQIATLEVGIDTLSTSVNVIVETFDNLQFEQISHLSDIDEMWSGLQELKRFSDSQFDKISKYMNEMEEFSEQKHAKEIDAEWIYSHSLGERLEKEADRIADNEKQLLKLQEQIVTAEDENDTLKNKTAIAYKVAGGAIALSALQLILSIAGIL